MEDINITNRLQEWRKKRGLTQQQLSYETKIPITTVQKIEQGNRNIAKLSTDMLLTLSRALGTSMEQLIQKDE